MQTSAWRACSMVDWQCVLFVAVECASECGKDSLACQIIMGACAAWLLDAHQKGVVLG